jgi:hypothetical protein
MGAASPSGPQDELHLRRIRRKGRRVKAALVGGTCQSPRCWSEGAPDGELPMGERATFWERKITFSSWITDTATILAADRRPLVAVMK